MGMFFLSFLTIFARHINIQPQPSFVFYDEIETPRLYKLLYDTRNKCKLTLSDPEDNIIAKDVSQSGIITTHMNKPGFCKISVQNTTNSVAKFSYKMPDVNKEMSGNLGYVEET